MHNRKFVRMLTASRNPTWTRKIRIDHEVDFTVFEEVGDMLKNYNPLAVYEREDGVLVAYENWLSDDIESAEKARVQLQIQHPSYKWTIHIGGPFAHINGIRKDRKTNRARRDAWIEVQVTSNHDAVLRDLENLNKLIEKINSTPIRAEITVD